MFVTFACSKVTKRPRAGSISNVMFVLRHGHPGGKKKHYCLTWILRSSRSMT